MISKTIGFRGLHNIFKQTQVISGVTASVHHSASQSSTPGITAMWLLEAPHGWWLSAGLKGLSGFTVQTGRTVGNTENYGKMWEHMGKYGKMWEKWENVGTYGNIWENMGKYGKMSWVTSSIPCWRYGSVFFGGFLELLRCGDKPWTLRSQQKGWPSQSAGRRVCRYISVRCNAFICCSTARWDFMSCPSPAYMCRSPSAFKNHFLDP